MSPKNLPDEVWHVIIDYLKRPKPKPGSLVTQRDIHQQDLASLMRIDTRIHDLAGFHLYHSVIAIDLLHLTLGWDSDSGKTTGGGVRKTRLELLRGVKKLFIVGGLFPGKVDPVGRLLADVPYDYDDYLKTQGSDEIILSAFEKAFACRSALLTCIASANVFQTLDCLAINAYECQLQKRRKLEPMLFAGASMSIGQSRNLLQFGQSMASPVPPGCNRISTARFHSNDIFGMPKELPRNVNFVLGPITPGDNKDLSLCFGHLARLLRPAELSDDHHHGQLGSGYPSFTVIIGCRATDTYCPSLDMDLHYNAIDLDASSSQSLTHAYFTACQRIWVAEAKRQNVPINVVRITTDLNAPPCAACGSVAEPDDHLQAEYPTEEAMEAFKAELRECQEEFERSHRVESEE